MNRDELKFEFSSLAENESFARTVVSAFIAKADPAVDEAVDIRTAVSEAVTNSIVHGYRKSPGKVTVSVKITETRQITIKVSDKGCGISDIKQAMTPLYTTDTASERAGLGFAVMESFMDSLKVRSTPGKGTAVTMKKNLG